MRSFYALIPFLLLLPSTVFSQAKPDEKAIYAADVAKVKDGDLDFDWKEFRLVAYRGGTDYYDWHPARNTFMQQMDKGDTDAALKTANEVIDHNMAEPEGHLLALVVYQKVGKKEEAAFQKKVIDAYLHSILASGDGKSRETAFVVVDESEEYFYLHIVLNVGLPLSQSLVEKEGHSYDLLKVKREDGSEQQVWFNVDISMNAMREAIEGGKKKKK
jgi:hypothetical protein